MATIKVGMIGQGMSWLDVDSDGLFTIEVPDGDARVPASECAIHCRVYDRRVLGVLAQFRTTEREPKRHYASYVYCYIEGAEGTAPVGGLPSEMLLPTVVKAVERVCCTFELHEAVERARTILAMNGLPVALKVKWLSGFEREAQPFVRSIWQDTEAHSAPAQRMARMLLDFSTRLAAMKITVGRTADDIVWWAEHDALPDFESFLVEHLPLGDSDEETMLECAVVNAKEDAEELLAKAS